jgi:predicted 3-demethylubiquinone-9 3-methyltransferase (glyoxalase superfamily)
MKTTVYLFLLTLLAARCLAMDGGGEALQQHGPESGAKQRMAVSLTFQKYDAETAMNRYVEIFDNSRIISIQRWGEDGPGKQGTIMMAEFELNGMRFVCSDSPPVHNWDFSPAVAIYVECTDEEEADTLFAKLLENGIAAMPLDNYGFSRKFGWVIDQFGVSWQVNLR